MRRTACWLVVPLPVLAALLAVAPFRSRLDALALDPASARLMEATALLAVVLPASLAVAAACFRQVRLVQAMTLLASLALAVPALGSSAGAPSARQIAAAFIAASIASAALLRARSLGAHLGLRALLGLAPVAALLALAHRPDAGTAIVRALGVQVPTPWGGTALALIGIAAVGVLGPLALRGVEGALDGAALIGALVAGALALATSLPLAADVLLASAACSGALALGALAWRRGHVDALTCLPARRALDEALDRLARSHCVAVIDVDHFKRFNDRHGHDVGDEVLRLVARILGRLPRGTAYRQGGEEFVVLLPRTSLAESAALMETLRTAIESAELRLAPSRARRGRKSAAPLKVTVSIGLATRDARAPAPRETLKAADHALLRAKRCGRNCVEIERRRAAPAPASRRWRPHLVVRRVAAG